MYRNITVTISKDTPDQAARQALADAIEKDATTNQYAIKSIEYHYTYDDDVDYIHATVEVNAVNDWFNRNTAGQ